MEKLVTEMKQLVKFKDTTDVGDVVLIVAKEPQMLIYALVSGITRDTSRKDEWWHMDMVFLSIPPQKVTWTLRTEQMTGQEIFTMGGNERFVKAIAIPDFSHQSADDLQKKVSKNSYLKRVK